jgi:hypothetical protein
LAKKAKIRPIEIEKNGSTDRGITPRQQYDVVHDALLYHLLDTTTYQQLSPVKASMTTMA